MGSSSSRKRACAILRGDPDQLPQGSSGQAVADNVGSLPSSHSERRNRDAHVARRQVGPRHRGEQGDRQRHRPRLRPPRRQGAGGRPQPRRGGGDRRRDQRRGRQGLGLRRRRPRPRDDGGGGRGRGRAPRRARHPLRQCRHLPAGEDRGDDARPVGRGDRHQPQGHLHLGEGLHPGAEGERRGADRHHLVDHRAGDRLSRAGPTTAPRRRGSSASSTPPASSSRNTGSRSTRCCRATS